MKLNVIERFRRRLPVGSLLFVSLVLAPVVLAQATRVEPQTQAQPNQQPGVNPPVGVPLAPGQQAQPQTGITNPMDIPRGGDLILGPGDVIDIQISDAPEISGKYLISDAGEIHVPTVPDPIHVSGLTTSQLSSAVANALKDAKQLKDPAVSVFVQEYHSHTVTVLGAVQKPGQYPIETRTTLLQAISEAGGLAVNAGNIATISHNTPASHSNTTGTVVPAKVEQEQVNINQLASGQNPALSVYVQAGDVITVSTAAVVYVVGAVSKPGAFALNSDQNDITVLQALSLVGGFAPSASPNRAVIVRNSTNPQKREDIPVNLNKVLQNKGSDVKLEANDILFVPVSGMKKGLHRTGEAAVSAATTVVGLGIAYHGIP
jgi:polysaccharide biosynthesis/export protein